MKIEEEGEELEVLMACWVCFDDGRHIMKYENRRYTCPNCNAQFAPIATVRAGYIRGD